MSRYVVGIDLGTTNCALAYADTREATPDGPAPIRTLRDPAGRRASTTSASGRSCPRSSTCPPPRSFPPGRLDLPWKSPPSRVVGTFAREHGAKVPGRLVSSAKSWLSHPGVDRQRGDPPLDARPRTSTKVSPVEASTAYLAHLRDAWNHEIAGKTAADRLEHQDVLLTVPASFDAAARELTVEAARAAGLEQVTLLEEPQAAFYAWLAAQGDQLAEAGQGRRHPAGLRRRRRDDRLHPDRRDRPGRRPRPDPAGRRRAHPARRRQHGPRPGPRRRRDPAQRHGRARRRPARRRSATPAATPRRPSSPTPRRRRPRSRSWAGARR